MADDGSKGKKKKADADAADDTVDADELDAAGEDVDGDDDSSGKGKKKGDKKDGKDKDGKDKDDEDAVEVVVEPSTAGLPGYIGIGLLGGVIVGFGPLRDAAQGNGPFEDAMVRFVGCVLFCLVAASFIGRYLDNIPFEEDDEGDGDPEADGETPPVDRLRTGDGVAPAAPVDRSPVDGGSPLDALPTDAAPTDPVPVDPLADRGADAAPA